ncbi:MAG TPA: threonine synthase [Thermoanaerobaculia bacterium]|nr:threonine synthase [Thermoanaerobaculia bacterium]
MFSFFAHLVCMKCGRVHERDSRFGVCPAPECGGPLFARYHDRSLDRDAFADRPRTMWRWREMMPLEEQQNVVTLGEGGTPLLRADRLGTRAGFSDLWIKDESGNPTGSFKARGLSAAVSKAKELGFQRIALPSAGNAGGAAAAYAARAGMSCDVFLPRDTPPLFQAECERYGARVTLVDGLIDACGKLVAAGAAEGKWHDVSTLKEPYRVEGKKTMGYELAEDLRWELPDAVIYPTGGGTGLIGMWKAFEEMERLGWIGSKRPRMISVQAEGCAPIVKAFAEGRTSAERWENAATYASGLRVPKAFADFLILADVRESSGDAVAVSDDEMREAESEIGAAEGLFVCPEGAATWAAAKKLANAGRLDRQSRVVLFNTGTGFKYVSPG